MSEACPIYSHLFWIHREQATVSEQPTILFLEDLARELRTSVSTLRRRIAAGDDLPPRLPAIDKRPRWTRAAVDAWLAKPAHTVTFRRRRWA